MATSASCSGSRSDGVQITVPEVELKGTVYRAVAVPRRDSMYIILYTVSGRRVELWPHLNTEPNSTMPMSALTVRQTFEDLCPGDVVHVTGLPSVVINGTVCRLSVTQLSVVTRAKRTYTLFDF